MATNIQEAKSKIQAGGVKDRAAGLKALIHILKHNRGKPSLETVGNKAYLALCETLFQALQDTLAGHRKKPTTASIGYINLAADALRHVVAAGVRTIKGSTVEIIIETVITELSGEQRTFEPLQEHLPKTLKALLEYQPHVERLSKECWDSIADFCTSSLTEILADASVGIQNSWTTDVSSRARTPLETIESSRASPRAPSLKVKTGADERMHSSEVYVQCLHLLVKASNAPLPDKAGSILNAFLRFLQQRSGRGTIAVAALAGINSILARISLQCIDMTKSVIRELLPLMKPMWSELVLREEVMITLAYTEAHILSLLADLEDTSSHVDLEGLIETMYNDYRRRQEIAVQQYLEDEYLCFRRVEHVEKHNLPLHTYAFSMEQEYQRHEGLWATVSYIAHFSFMLDERRQTLQRDRSDPDASLNKRVRHTKLFPEYVRNIMEPRSNAKRAALQVVAFMIQEGPIEEEDLLHALEKLTSCMSDENSVHSIWAMIALTGATFQVSATETRLLPYWVTVWQKASRAVTSSSMSRAACHLMDVLLRRHIVPFSAVSETVQSMLLSVESNGPSLLTEASSSLMITIIRERIEENPTNSDMTAERILHWLLNKWNPSLWSDRVYSSLNAHHCAADDILHIIYACFDRPFDTREPSTFRILGPIAQAQLCTSQSQGLTQYLLLSESKENHTTSYTGPYNARTISEHRPAQLQNMLLDFCVSELGKVQQCWDDFASHGITSDSMRIITTLCIVAPAIPALCDSDDRRTSKLLASATAICESFAAYLAKPQIEQYRVDIVLETCSKSLPSLSILSNTTMTFFEQRGLSVFAQHLTKAIKSRREIKQSFYADDQDFMEVDDEPDSQMTMGTLNAEVDVARHDLQVESDASAFYTCCSLYLHLIATLTEAIPAEIHNIPSSFVDHLISLHENDLLRCRPFLRALWRGSLELSRADCLNLLDRFSEALIDPRAREYNTSEVANGMLVEVLSGTSLVWTPDASDREAQELFENAEALYTYYNKDMEQMGVRRSVNLQKAIATFLQGLLKHQVDFGPNRKVPSVRTSLFELLANGEIPVRYHIAQYLPMMFEDFVLSEHDKIFRDIERALNHTQTGEVDDGVNGHGNSENNIMADGAISNNVESTAIKLLVLAKLASQWHTLLRQGIYRMFATAAMVPGSAGHAKRCIADVAIARGAGSPQRLFQLFSAQIIFKWLRRNEGTLAKIPHAIFDYSSLADLLRDAEGEAVGQAIMLGQMSEIDYLGTQLEHPPQDLLARNIGKAAAYTIAWDTCYGFARDKAKPSVANLLKETMGQEKYFHLVQQELPQVLAQLFQTLDSEDRAPKSLEKKSAFNNASKCLAEMTRIGHSTLGLDVGIEPAFSAYYLPDELERLCRRTGDSLSTVWTPSMYTYVMRTLLDQIHPALGPLFARSIICKIRLLVALSGQIAYEGYPLQMTLQSLRPFLTDIHCAEDTVGIMQYLFEHGAGYLRQHLNFLAGIGLSILISIRVFLGSSQDSTTQQSQHVATMTAANRFHAWLSDYLKAHARAIEESTDRSSVNKPAIKAFRSITAAASQVRVEGNSMQGTEESRLLLEILDDVKSGRKLLNKTSREVALDLLCRNFHPADNSREDILGDDQKAVQYASQVWESCRRNNVGQGYLLWAARVLGRAFGAIGEIEQSSTGHSLWNIPSRSSKDSLAKTSRTAIAREVIDLFYSDDRNEVSLAEDVVRRLTSRLRDADPQYVAEMQNVIPDAISHALSVYMPQTPDPRASPSLETLEHAACPTPRKPVAIWLKDLALALCRTTPSDPILGALPKLLRGLDHVADRLLPYILHLVLLNEYDGERTTHTMISEAVSGWFRDCDAITVPYSRTLIKTILYLRSQPVPKEASRVDRDRWLSIDFLSASQAANTCAMYRSALLFAETSSGQPILKSSTRRSSVLVDPPKLPLELQLSIYKNLDEPDSFYGIDRGSSLLSVLERLDYEKDGVKSLLFRGARLDSQMRRMEDLESSDSTGTVKSLVMLNMNSITQSLLSNGRFRDLGDNAVENTLHIARKLGQWDIKAPDTNHAESTTVFKAFQGLQSAKNMTEARGTFDRQLLATMGFLTGGSNSAVPIKVRLRTLGALTEADDIIRAERPDHLLDMWDRMKARERWMKAGEFDDVRQLLSCRETLFGVLSSNSALLDSFHTRTATIRGLEVNALVSSSTICRRHGALQESLASVTYLSDIVRDCKSVGLDIEATAQNEVANLLWDQGETEVSIRMRQDLIDNVDFNSQDTNLSLPVLLARLGHHLAEARLAKPDTIMQEYLDPAIRELKGQKQGAGPGQVFHEFALFCDKQLLSPEAAEDMARVKTVMDRKLQEYHDFSKLSRTDKSRSMRDTYHRSARKAKGWYDLDHAEYERLRKGREQFLKQCLENYLLSLFASDEYNNDALRVFSLWLEYSDTKLANNAVQTYLKDVPSGKFAMLMNQLSSRLQAEESDFQQLLMELVTRICIDHPYHGMHQIFAIQTKVGQYSREDMVRAKDESARSRQKAATGLASVLGANKKSRQYWNAISISNEIYHHLAMFKGEKESTQQGRELPLEKYKESRDLVSKVPKLQVPPATLQIEVRANMNYADLPRIHSFKPYMSIANGLSAPKIITARGTDGRPYKQLFKSGNDDLRQDAIMEQVFDQVSRLLKNHTATRIRNLGIRTYKVLPLSTRSGLMEFVQNTVPLHQWVMPAHEKYYPNDWKSDRCRKEIGACQGDSQATRVKTWRKVADNFHPVLRYFLLERFEDPDEWFERRLAYTRSTAAISILGHVLGLGDRHCHNILLDEKTGEIVHIDLGVSFEAGRVLPVPEVVPFRLTRDLVDAMGYTKTEGVFRRCCEFTMDTLREERESIMTLLNVLRYDPLVNWSITATKAKRMQENQDTNVASRSGTVGPGGTPAPSGAPSVSGQVGEEVVQDSQKEGKKEEQAGEAGRALSVVEKKLSKTLSTKATVNELIQQSTDERNLAVLYMGWASYA